MRKGGWLRVASVDVLRYVNGRGKQARSIVVRVDDLVLDCAHHLEAILVVDVAWGGTQRAATATAFGKGAIGSTPSFALSFSKVGSRQSSA